MPSTRMIVKTLTFDGVAAIYIANPDVDPPAVGSIDIYCGELLSSTVGRIHTSGAASVQVNPLKFAQLAADLSEDDEVRLVYSVLADGSKAVTNINITVNTAQAESVQALSAQISDLSKVIKRDLSEGTLDELKQMNRTLEKIFVVLDKRPDAEAEGLKRVV